MKNKIKVFLESQEPMAKVIRQAMRENKLPLLAECLTDKYDKDGTKNKD